MFDFSVLKDIDLTQMDNILFVVIFLVALIAVFLIIVFFVSKVIETIRTIFKKIAVRFFVKEVQKPSFGNAKPTKITRSCSSMPPTPTPAS